MSESDVKRETGQPLVSPQNTGDLKSVTASIEPYVVSPLSVDRQLQREIDLSYPEVCFLQQPGYNADEKYMPPRWYRSHPDHTHIEEKVDKTLDGGGAVPVSVTPQQQESGFDADSETREDVARAEATKQNPRRQLWIWIGIAAAVLVIIALAVGLDVGLGVRDSSDDNDTSTIPSNTSSAISPSQSSPDPPSTTSTPSSTRPTSSPTPSSTLVRCPASNSTTYTTNGKSFTIECGIDHSGGNIETMDADNLTTCIDSCAESKHCVGATFLGAACYLKRMWSDPVYGKSEVAGGRLVG
ncbi:hypothetical protein Slin15195_G063960 [Septoria linicola]|uniref:Apple domain-containing protein n=1 Tax=Septoria linicola TaxID=215465 RepID=A0A9Q9AP29_9PEZI|nr:hypothetical protein Slin14017_G114280 [Septoria linicola]USW53077.1 hypothetical protein Slin15195_G063960 [Septoria linicola]